MGGQACKAKIIMNGGTVQSETHALCYQIESDRDIDETVGYAIVDQLNIAEDAVFRAKRIYLESKGYHGPWPQSLRG